MRVSRLCLSRLLGKPRPPSPTRAAQRPGFPEPLRLEIHVSLSYADFPFLPVLSYECECYSSGTLASLFYNVPTSERSGTGPLYDLHVWSPHRAPDPDLRVCSGQQARCILFWMVTPVREIPTHVINYESGNTLAVIAGHFSRTRS